jgi:hypothetical protein
VWVSMYHPSCQALEASRGQHRALSAEVECSPGPASGARRDVRARTTRGRVDTVVEQMHEKLQRGCLLF